jgi:hypothetical protein
MDRCRQSGWACPDDRHVIDPIGIDPVDHANATSKLTLGRISQEPPVRTQHDRQLSLGNVEMVDQCTRRFVGIGIETLIRLAVSS